MDLINHSTGQQKSNIIATSQVKVVRDAEQMPDAVLRRLREEVKNENVNQMFAYDRAHNRHNRGK